MAEKKPVAKKAQSSGVKRAKQALVRATRNRQTTAAVRTQVRKAREAIVGKDAGAIAAELKKATVVLNKAVTKGTLHKSNASRRISRLNLAAAKATAAVAK